MGNRIDKEFVDEIRFLWRKSGYTAKNLQKKYGITKETIYSIVKNTRQSNDVNKNGFRVVRDFNPKFKKEGGPGRYNDRRKSYSHDKKSYSQDKKSYTPRREFRKEQQA